MVPGVASHRRTRVTRSMQARNEMAAGAPSTAQSPCVLSVNKSTGLVVYVSHERDPSVWVLVCMCVCVFRPCVGVCSTLSPVLSPMGGGGSPTHDFGGDGDAEFGGSVLEVRCPCAHAFMCPCACASPHGLVSMALLFLLPRVHRTFAVPGDSPHVVFWVPYAFACLYFPLCGA